MKGQTLLESSLCPGSLGGGTYRSRLAQEPVRLLAGKHQHQILQSCVRRTEKLLPAQDAHPEKAFAQSSLCTLLAQLSLPTAEDLPLHSTFIS